MVEKVEEVERTDRYRVVSQLIDEWLPVYHDWFSSEDVWRHITGQGVILSVQGKKDVAKKLETGVERKLLRRHGKKYKAIDKSTVKKSNPFTGARENLIKLRTPSMFGFNETINVSEGDVWVIAGESNQGKSTLAMNILGDNMDSFPCYFISTEMTESKFVKRFRTMSWHDPYKENGDLKYEWGFTDATNYEEMIDPDKINIIDWVGLPDKYYLIENTIRDMKAYLNKGIAVLVLQKKEGQDAPVGGEFAYRRADVCLTISRGLLKVLKVKDWNPPNPNYKMFAFGITDNECHFDNVREVVKCGSCKGYGKNFGKECSTCSGSGFRDKEDYLHDV